MANAIQISGQRVSAASKAGVCVHATRNDICIKLGRNSGAVLQLFLRGTHISSRVQFFLDIFWLYLIMNFTKNSCYYTWPRRTAFRRLHEADVCIQGKIQPNPLKTTWTWIIGMFLTSVYKSQVSKYLTLSWERIVKGTNIVEESKFVL